MEEPWEVLETPPEIVHSSKNGMDPDEETSSSEQSLNPKSVPKLCGFLNKLGEKGLIKTWKSRWFVFDENRCRLFYFRTPQDHVPLGLIEVAHATFSFQAENPDRLNQFDICVLDRKYHLQAKDKQTMMFWLQELQTKRRDFSRKRTSFALQNRDLQKSISLMNNSGGLMGSEHSGEENNSNDSEAYKQASQVMQRVPPPETVGQEAALKSPSGGGGVFNLSFNNIKTEFRNISAKRFSTTSSSINFNAATSSTISPQEESESNKKTELVKNINEAANSGHGSFQSHIKASEETTCLQGGQEVSSTTSEEQCSRPSTPDPARHNVAGALRRKFAASRPVNSPTPNKCLECEKLRASLQSCETELTSARDEISVRQEVILNLHELLRKFQIEKSDGSQTDQKKLEDEMQSKNEYIKKLEEQIQEQNEKHEKDLKEKDKQLCGLLEQIQMYQEMTAVKDEVVVSLTNQLHLLEKSLTKQQEEEEVGEEVEPESPTLRETQTIEKIHEMDKLKEACQAYAMQNRFINSEILELNRLRQDDEEQLRLLSVKLATAEAEICKFKSKYLLVLRELQRPRKGGDTSDDDVIGQLLQDALDSETMDKASLSRSVMAPYDQWGFHQKLESQDEDAFLSMANRLGRRSEEIKANRQNQETSNAVKWDNYMVTHQNREFQKTIELKSLVRSGIPDQYRAQVWRQCIELYVRETKKISCKKYYQTLLESKQEKFSPAAKQIGLDLLRTLPNNINYDRPDAPGIEKLRRVLLAFSFHNRDVGYCQGINRLVAIALLYLTEEEAFWCLVAFVEHLMPKDYYSRTLLAAQADQRVLKDLMAEKLPRIHAHLESIGVDLSLLTFNWFLTVFVDSFPMETILRVWDCFLYEGNKVLFRFALAVFKINEESILKIEDSTGIFNFMRQVPERIADQHLLIQTAFQGLNPFPMQKIRTKRRYHIGLVQAELEEFDQLRDSYVKERDDSERLDVISDNETAGDD